MRLFSDVDLQVSRSTRDDPPQQVVSMASEQDHLSFDPGRLPTVARGAASLLGSLLGRLHPTHRCDATSSLYSRDGKGVRMDPTEVLPERSCDLTP